MAWYPKAIRKPIPPGTNDPKIIPVGLVYHVRDGIGDSLYPYFSGPSGGVESHWYIRYDGTVEQYRDTLYEADANGMGNSWVLGGKRYGLHSVETEGRERGKWTPEQIEALKALTRWDARIHGWPVQLAPDWNGPGVGYHVMFGAPGPWTSVAKTCPGPDRVRQFEQIFVPWLATAGKPTPAPAPAPEEDDMPTPGELWSYKNPEIEPDDDTYSIVVQTRAQGLYLEEQVKSVGQALNILVDGLVAGGVITKDVATNFKKGMSGQLRDVPAIKYLPRP